MQKNKQEVKKTVLVLLEKENVTKAEIMEDIEKKFVISRAEIRNIIREIRTDLIEKLKVLQSGLIKV